MLVAGAFLLGCDGAGDKLAPTGTDGGGGIQGDLIGTTTQTADQGTEWLTRALLYPELASDDPQVTASAEQFEAADADDDKPFKVDPFEFDPFKTYLVRSRWLRGTGCPTGATWNDGTNSMTYTDPACPTGDPKDKKNEGLLLAKTGPTANFASADAEIKGVKGIVLSELGWDIRAGSHCGNGAPRWNVVTSDGVNHFVGCNTGAPVLPAGSTATPTPSHPWVRQRWTAAALASGAVAFPAISMGSTIKSISIIFDEGQDTPFFSGDAFLDNIDINGQLTGRGPGN